VNAWRAFCGKQPRDYASHPCISANFTYVVVSKTLAQLAAC
jgi:hypothetical protein